MDCDIKKRIDSIGFADLKLIQNSDQFCYGIDAVILSDFVKIKGNANIIDMGTGNGIIPLILSHKTKAAKIIGIELQKEVFALAEENIKLNSLEDRIEIYNMDILDAPSKFGLGSFSTVVSNPPYMAKDSGISSSIEAKSISRHESTANLYDFIETAGKLLKDQGDFFLVHRPLRLVDIICFARQNNLEPKKIRLVHPDKNKKPNIMLLHCVKNARPELKFMKPLYVYNSNGDFTQEINKIYER